ncbi:MAG: hypothetical protein JSS53_07610 [Proteobacteria bacterium]|nr:hypothetical protein [Pseudomonadota bacterium]
MLVRMQDGNQCTIKRDDTTVEFLEIGSSLGMIVLTEEGRAVVARIALPKIGEIVYDKKNSTETEDLTEALKLTFKDIELMIQIRIEQVLKNIVTVEKWQMTQIVFLGNKFWTNEITFFESKFWADKIDSFKSGALTTVSNFLGFPRKTQEFQVTLLTAPSDQAIYRFEKKANTITCIDDNQEVQTKLVQKVESVSQNPKLDEKYWEDVEKLPREVRENPEAYPVSLFRNSDSVSHFMDAIANSNVPLEILGKYLNSLLPIFAHYQLEKLPQTLLCLISFSEQNTKFKKSFQTAFEKYLPELAFLLSSAALNQLFEAFKNRKGYQEIVKNKMYKIVCRYVDSLCTRKISESADDVIGVFNNLKGVNQNKFYEAFYGSREVAFFGKYDQRFRCNFNLWFFSSFQSTSTVLKKLDETKIKNIVNLSVTVRGLDYSLLVKSKTLPELIAIMRYFCDICGSGVVDRVMGRNDRIYSEGSSLGVESHTLKYPFLITAVEHYTTEDMIEMMRFLSTEPLRTAVLYDQLMCAGDLGSETFLSLLSKQRNIDSGFTEVLKFLTDTYDYRNIADILAFKRDGKTVLENLFECNKLEYLKALRFLVEYFPKQIDIKDALEKWEAGVSHLKPVDCMRVFLQAVSKKTKKWSVENPVRSDQKEEGDTLLQFTAVQTGEASEGTLVSSQSSENYPSKNNLNKSKLSQVKSYLFSAKPNKVYEQILSGTQGSSPLEMADHAEKVSLDATYENFLSSLIQYGPPIVNLKARLFIALLVFEQKLGTAVTLQTMTLSDMPEVVESPAPFRHEALSNP